MNNKLILEQMIRYDKNYISENFIPGAAPVLVVALGFLAHYLMKKKAIDVSMKRYNINKDDSEQLQILLHKRIDEISDFDKKFIDDLISNLKINKTYELFKSDITKSYNIIMNIEGNHIGLIDYFTSVRNKISPGLISNTIKNKNSLDNLPQIRKILKYLLTKFK